MSQIQNLFNDEEKVVDAGMKDMIDMQLDLLLEK
jgi:hypothetical protein